MVFAHKVIICVQFLTCYMELNNMSRPPIPTAILEARGSFIQNPSRKRTNEPDGGKPLGSPPKYLSDHEVEVWKEIKRDIPHGVAKKSDRHSFETLVILKVKERTGMILAADRGQLITLYAQFGLTPASRSKVSVPAAPKSTLNDFLKKKAVTAPVPEATASVEQALMN